LVVHDPGRFDFPWPIRTQDVARLHADQSFELLGRYEHAPLKGCSLLAEELLKTASADGAPEHAKRKFASNGFRREGFVDRVRAFFSSLTWKEAAQREFAEGRLADLVTEDILASLPATDGEL